MPHSYHCHPRLGAGMHGPMVGNQRLHVRQGEVDATCGYHCVLMALMLPSFMVAAKSTANNPRTNLVL